MSRHDAISYLKTKKKPLSEEMYGDPKNIFYVLCDNAKNAFRRKLEKEVDFALLPNAQLWQSDKKLVKNDGSYLLFKMHEGQPKVVKKESFGLLQTRIKTSTTEGFWSTVNTDHLFED